MLLSIEQLNERLWHWLDTVYHRHEHSALHTTPLLRWQRDIEQVRQLPPATDLRRLFFHRVDRLVRRDSTFLLKNRFFEAPPQLAGQRIEVRFDPLERNQRHEALVGVQKISTFAGLVVHRLSARLWALKLSQTR